MIQIIDYNLDFFELFIQKSYSNLIIDGVKNSIGSYNKYTISKIPQKIQTETSTPSAPDYEYLGKKLSSTEFSNLRNSFINPDYFEDEDCPKFLTQEDKNKYEDLISSAVTVLNPPVTSIIDLEFEVVKKEFVPSKYENFIKSSIILDNGYKAICTYTFHYQTMLRDIAKKNGFNEVVDAAFTNNTKGKYFSINSSKLEYCKVNNTYVTEYLKDKKLTINTKGSLEQCVSAYTNDYSVLETFFLIQIQKIDGVTLSNIASILEELYKIRNLFSFVDTKQSTRDQYSTGMKNLKNLINELENEAKSNNYSSMDHS